MNNISLLILNKKEHFSNIELNLIIQKLNIPIININEQLLNIIQQTDYTIENLIYQELSKLEVPKHLNGYNYIQKAILLLTNNNYTISHIYNLLATEYNKSEKSIEKAIRNCIEATFLNGNKDSLKQTFNNYISIDNGKISNKKFIHIIKENIMCNDNVRKSNLLHK